MPCVGGDQNDDAYVHHVHEHDGVLCVHEDGDGVDHAHEDDDGDQDAPKLEYLNSSSNISNILFTQL